jgi:cephalosporin hydroxylase
MEKRISSDERSGLHQHKHDQDPIDQGIIDKFQNLWRGALINDRLTFMGQQTCKTPMDLWVYQEILWDLKPSLIIECGTWSGGTAYYLACLLEIIGRGSIVTVDTQQRERPYHDRLTYIEGSSIDEGFEVVQQYMSEQMAPGPVLVILDSEHRCDHVLKEMELYHNLVTVGSYMIVEDSDLNGHPTGDMGFWRLGNPGPHEAIEEFLSKHASFEIDKSREKFLVTVCKDGFLKRTK